MNSLIITILTSSVVATVLSIAGTVIGDKRKYSLEYITKERAAWRKDIRAIAEEIAVSDEKTIHKALTKLQVRINAYDRFLIKNHPDGDQFIWICIRLCEDIKEREALDVVKKKLLIALSLMLKYDWERSKEEIKGNINRLKSTFGSLIQILVYFLLIPILNMPLPPVAMLIWTYVILGLMESSATVRFGGAKIKNKIINETTFSLLFFIISFFFTLITFIVSKNIFLQTLHMNIVGRIVCAITCMMPSALALVFKLENTIYSEMKVNYLTCMEKLYKEMDGEMKKFANKEEDN